MTNIVVIVPTLNEADVNAQVVHAIPRQLVNRVLVVDGRPRGAVFLKVHVCRTSSRCHFRSVSGLTRSMT